MQKARIKNIQLIVKCYLLYNMAMNLFFRHNNLLICYIKGFLTHKYIVDIDWSTKLYDCKLKLHEGGGIIIGKKGLIHSLSVTQFSTKSKVCIGNNCFINGGHRNRVVMNMHEERSIIIGDDCIFSNNIEMHTTDYHSVTDDNGKRTNHANDIIIGNHCWIGLRCLILKGVSLPAGTIVGAGSVVTKRFIKENTLIGGSPAQCLREHINWTIHRL